MKRTWQELKIGDLGRIVTGKTPSTKHPSYFGSEFPFITPTDMVGQKRADITERYLSTEGATLLRRNIIPEGSVAVSCIGWQMGKVIMTSRPSFTNQQLNTIIPNEKVNTNFLYYVLSVRKQELLSLGSGTGVRTPILNKSAFSDLKVVLPALSIQRKIADVLSAYDDLIEVNARRIRVLEQMAQSVYREWFGKVDVKSLPRGWDIVKVGDRFITALGGTPSRAKDDYWLNGTIPWINSSKCNLLRVTEPSEYITELGLNNSSTKLMPKRTTIIALTGATLGQLSLTEIETCANQSIVGIWDNDKLYSEYIYLTFREIIQKVIQRAGGAAQQHINKEIVNEVEVVLPPKDLMKQFQEIEKPLFDLLANLLWKNANLRRTRNLLLPRLVSGEIEVDGLKIAESNNV